MSTTTIRKFKVGDKVTPDPEAPGVPVETLGRVFTVAKVNPKNLRCTADDGGRGINFPESLLLDGNKAKDAFAPRPFVPVEFFSLGEIVTIKRAWQTWTTETPLVVTNDKGGDKVNVALLGGDNDRYARVPRANLVRRDMSWLADSLVDMVTA